MIKLTKKMLEVETRVGQPLGAYLRSSYEDGYKTTYELAEELGVSNITIGKWLKGYSIETRTASEAHLPKGFKKPSEERLRTLYVDKHKTTAEIAEEIGVGISTVCRWLKGYSIETRTASETHLPKGFKKPSEERLRTLYIGEHKTTREIAVELGVHNYTIGKWLKGYGINRDQEELNKLENLVRGYFESD